MDLDMQDTNFLNHLILVRNVKVPLSIEHQIKLEKAMKELGPQRIWWHCSGIHIAVRKAVELDIQPTCWSARASHNHIVNIRCTNIGCLSTVSNC